MYLSEVRIVNWRSYRDVTFTFPEPTARKPMALVGAMNGHGKTSFLYALYFGLFGRYATSFAQEFLDPKEDAWRGYRHAMADLRRKGSDSADQTEVEITLSRSRQDSEGFPTIRVHRQWFFNAKGELRDRGEEVKLFLDEHLVEYLDPKEPDELVRVLEDLLFPPHVLPAFFFDGEQALRRVEATNERQMKDAVEILFGTRLLNDVCSKLDRYCEERRLELRKAAAGADATRLDQLYAERDRMEADLRLAEAELAQLTAAKSEADRQFEAAKMRLVSLGLDNADEIRRYAELYERAKVAREQHGAELRRVARELALPMALGRAPAIKKRLEQEKLLEEWEAVRASTRSRAPVVLDRAFPVPDALLEGLSAEKLSLLKDRVRQAIDAIYEPPPEGCGEVPVFGHIRGETRTHVRREIDEALRMGADRVRQVARLNREAKEAEEEARRKWEQFRDLTEIANRLQQEMDAALNRSKEVSRAIGAAETRLPALRADLGNKLGEIVRVEKAIDTAAPIQKRIVLAEQSREALKEFGARLRPIALDRISASVGQHFRAMADVRFKAAEVIFREDGSAALHDGAQEWAVAKMGGFEKRVFGIAFTLALAEVTGIRAPLVIDTPIGNADSKYRQRVLKHLSEAKLDQVIILTHDEEVNGKYYEAIRAKVAKQYLVEYREAGSGPGYSVLHEGKFFAETR